MSDRTCGAALSWPRYAFLWVALAVCAVSQWHIYWQTEWRYSSWGLGIGALLAGWALGAPASLRAERFPTVSAPISRLNTAVGTILGVLGLLAALDGTSLLFGAGWFENFGPGWALVVGGTVMWSYGLRRLDSRLRKPAGALPWSRIERFSFIAVVLFGLFLRFYRYDYFPPPDGVCSVEEPQSGQGALFILEGGRPWEFLLDRLMPIVAMKAHLLFFPDQPMNISTIRVPFTIVSWLTIIPLYLLLRELVSRPAALFATLLFTFCRWHLMYARLAHAIFGPTLPIILTALYLSVHVYRRGGWAAYPWIGALTAYTLYAYAGYRGTSFFIALFFFISVVHHIRILRAIPDPDVNGATRRSLRIQLVGMAIAAIGFSFVFVPQLGQLMAYRSRYFVEAVDRATDDPGYYTGNWRTDLAVRRDRLKIAAMMFNHWGDGSPTFNLPGAPQLDPVSGALFAIGLAYCIIWGVYRFQGFFAFYLLFIFLMGTVFVHNYDIRRLQGIIPLIFIVLAFAADRFGEATIARFGRRARGAVAGLAGVIVGAAFADNYHVYFQQMMNDPVVRSSFHNSYTVAVSYLHRLPNNAYLLLLTDMPNFFAPSDFEWVRGNRVPGNTGTDLTTLFQGAEGPWQGRELHLLIQESLFESEELKKLLLARFPTAQCAPYEHPDGPQFARFLACRIPSEADHVGFQGGIKARYFHGAESTPFLERLEPVISYAFVPDECHFPQAEGKLPCRAEWEGSWEITEEGDYTILAETRHGKMEVRVDDRELLPPAKGLDDAENKTETTIHLAPGRHTIIIKARYNDLELLGTRLSYGRKESELGLLPFATIGRSTQPAEPQPPL